jgi:hypothetical protein
VTIGRLVAWMMVWMSGWALFFLHPAGHSTVGTILLLAVAPLVMVTPREWKVEAIRRETIAVILMVLAFLVLVFVLPPSWTWQFPRHPRLVATLWVVGSAIALSGIGIMSHRFAREHAGAV